MASTIPCPICGRRVLEDDPNMPFCSDRCRTADLANWATDQYVVPGGSDTSELENLEGDTPDRLKGRRQ